jgi:hypothetical protein
LISPNKGEIVMKKISSKRAFLIAAVIICGVSVSVQWPQGLGLTVSVDSAQARVGRPLTPVSAAGVARRTTRRHVYGAPVVVGAPVVHRHVVVVH